MLANNLCLFIESKQSAGSIAASRATGKSTDTDTAIAIAIAITTRICFTHSFVCVCV